MPYTNHYRHMEAGVLSLLSKSAPSCTVLIDLNREKDNLSKGITDKKRAAKALFTSLKNLLSFGPS